MVVVVSVAAGLSVVVWFSAFGKEWHFCKLWWKEPLKTIGVFPILFVSPSSTLCVWLLILTEDHMDHKNLVFKFCSCFYHSWKQQQTRASLSTSKSCSCLYTTSLPSWWQLYNIHPYNFPLLFPIPIPHDDQLIHSQLPYMLQSTLFFPSLCLSFLYCWEWHCGNSYQNLCFQCCPRWPSCAISLQGMQRQISSLQD